MYSAIQPSASSRHLKEIHQIYRNERQDFLQYIQSLDLSNPADVILPQPHENAVPFLLIENGLACTENGCHHLCVTAKRMKSHWATVHGGVAAGTIQWLPVHLQTFFRGNQLKYFVVSASAVAAPEEEGISDETDTLNFPPTCHAHFKEDAPALLEHFQQHTYLDLGYSSTTKELWRTVIPELALHHPFLKHGLLACSALHLAHLNPKARQRHQLTAAYYQHKALPEFRLAIGNVNESNCNALLAFSQLLIIHCFAADEQDETLFLVGAREEAGLPDWLQVIRGSCSLFGDSWEVIRNGALMPLVTEGLWNQHDLPRLTKSKYAARLDVLVNMPFSGKGPTTNGVNDKNFSSLAGAFVKLHEAFAIAEEARAESKYTLWTAVHSWPAQVPQEYLDLLKDRDPIALILLAHFCILLEPFESDWCFTGFRKRLLSRIYKKLDPEWRQWLRWPLEEIGLQE